MPAPRPIRVGDLVRFRFGVSAVQGVVKEDRGPIGIGGRHLYLIQFNLDQYSSPLIELPADQLELVSDPVSR